MAWQGTTVGGGTWRKARHWQKEAKWKTPVVRLKSVLFDLLGQIYVVLNFIKKLTFFLPICFASMIESGKIWSPDFRTYQAKHGGRLTLRPWVRDHEQGQPVARWAVVFASQFLLAPQDYSFARTSKAELTDTWSTKIHGVHGSMGFLCHFFSTKGRRLWLLEPIRSAGALDPAGVGNLERWERCGQVPLGTFGSDLFHFCSADCI